MSKLDHAMLDALMGKLEKASFSPMNAQGPVAPPPQDPTGGAPMAPPAGVMPDPSQAAAVGVPGTDQSAAAGVDPNAVAAAPTAAAPATPAAAPAAAAPKSGKKENELKEIHDKLDTLITMLNQLFGAVGISGGTAPAPQGSGMGSAVPPDASAAPQAAMPPAAAMPPQGAPPDAMAGAPKAASAMTNSKILAINRRLLEQLKK